MPSGRPRSRRLAITSALVIVAAVLIPVAAVAAPSSKGQDPNVLPATVSRGTTAAFAVSIKNTSTSGNITAQGIRVYIPAGLATSDIQLPIVKPPAGTLTNPATTLAAPSPYIEILNANVTRNQTYTFTINARIPCDESVSAYSWVTDVRQSNDFSGTGNELPAKDVPVTAVSSASCYLAFTTQPTNAAASTTITGTAFDPSGPAVTVSARNGAGGPVSWFAGTITLTSTPSTTLTGGSVAVTNGAAAAFTNLQIAETGTYTLTAATTVPGVSGSAASNAFVIGYSASADCEVDGQPCTTGTFPGPTGSTANVTVNDTGSEIVATLSAELTEDVLDCPGFDFEYGDTLEFDVVTTDDLTGYTKTVEVTKDAIYGTDAADLWKYQVCFQADYPFASIVYYDDPQENYENLLNILAGGPLPTADEVAPGVYRGILPDCSLVDDVAPCIEGRTFNGAGTRVTTIGTVPAADPQWK